jgi:hypothetical protein
MLKILTGSVLMYKIAKGTAIRLRTSPYLNEKNGGPKLGLG